MLYLLYLLNPYAKSHILTNELHIEITSIAQILQLGLSFIFWWRLMSGSSFLRLFHVLPSLPFCLPAPAPCLGKHCQVP